MIVFDLQCETGHRFEGWFASSNDYVDQLGRSLVRCPVCDSADVVKAPMAPAVPSKGKSEAGGKGKVQVANSPIPKEVADAFKALAKAQAAALGSSEWVGERFADEVRAMHYGEAEEKLVHGRATRSDAEALLDEGIAVAPLLVPVCPPEERN